MEGDLPIVKWLKSLITNEICPRCKQGKIIRYNKAYFCSKNGADKCMYGVRKDENYKGATEEIVGARTSRRSNDADYKRAIEENFAKGQRGETDRFNEFFERDI